MRELVPLARVVTPNVPEAEVLSGKRIQSEADLKDAARRIHDIGGAAVIITGGHHARYSHEVVDTLYDGHRFSEYRTRRIDTPNTHGTGCTFASAVAAHLALGDSLEEAAARAQRNSRRSAAARAVDWPRQRPLGHFWK